ncbi:MAG: rhomboid family intramembrane serine protease [Deltaproteobacteria bacterium]|nr:rhomboid family intramembrane serine protease [Candidatus Anaeroferrophillacea bacterium]
MAGGSRNSFLCPGCRRLISIDEPRCPFCGLSHPHAVIRRDLIGGLLRDPGDIIRVIIGINIGFFIFTLLLNPAALGFSANPFALLSPSDRSLLIAGATGRIPIDRLHRWWTLVSANFLHGGILHLFFNMAALNQLGPFVVREYGLHRFLIIYLLSGIFGFFVSWFAGVPLTIGASAAVCGLIGAILYYGRSRGGHYGMAIYRQAMGWIVGLAIFGLLMPGINNWGHGGGIVAGIVTALLLGYREHHQETVSQRLLALGLSLLTVAVLGWAVFQSLLLRFMS